MDRRTYIQGVGAAIAIGALAGCTSDESGSGDNSGGDGDSNENAYGMLSTSVTDQPNDIDDFESLVVTLQGIWIKPAEADDEPENETEESEGTEDNETEGEEEESRDREDIDQSSGRTYIEFDEPQEADLIELQGDNAQLIDETEAEVGDYQFLQLDVSGTEGILAETGEEATVETPGNAPLQFQQAFEIQADETTRFIADFTPFQTGQGNYIIRPVASGTQVLYGDEEYEGGEDDAEDEGGNDAGNDAGNETGGDAGNDAGGDQGEEAGNGG